MIEPTIGRVVWFHPDPRDEIVVQHKSDPCAAIVAFVHNPRLVNLCVIDHNGSSFARRSVMLVQDDDKRPVENFAEWMPYQRGQAAKADALQAQLPPVTQGNAPQTRRG